MIYCDGSALCRFLPDVKFHAAWNEWVASRLDQIATSQLGLTELRQVAELYPREKQERALQVVEVVRANVPVIRFSDQNVTASSHVAAVIQPFAALHLGAASTHPNIDVIATYDPQLATAAYLYNLAVVSPGLPEGWHNSESQES